MQKKKFNDSVNWSALEEFAILSAAGIFLVLVSITLLWLTVSTLWNITICDDICVAERIISLINECVDISDLTHSQCFNLVQGDE